MLELTHEQRSGITREQELALLAELYRLALEAHRREKAALQPLSRRPRRPRIVEETPGAAR